MSQAKTTCAVCTLVTALLGHLRAATAADTVEPFGIGASDVELYLGVEGIGLDRYEKTLFGDILLGYGLLERLSAYLGTTLEANEAFGDGAATIYGGIYGTPVDLPHFDLDLFLSISGGGPGLSELRLTPAVELNGDVDPDMRSFGVFLRVGSSVFGRDVTPLGDEASPTFKTAVDIWTTVGTCFTIRDRHQLILEVDMTFRPAPSVEERSVEVGGMAVGYNVILHDAIEMITQISFDIPQSGESFSVGLFTGMIVTLPSP